MSLDHSARLIPSDSLVVKSDKHPSQQMNNGFMQRLEVQEKTLGNVAENQAEHSKFISEQREARKEQQAALQELMGYVEKLVTKQEGVGEQHAKLQDRADALERLVMGSADKQTRLEQSHIAHAEKYARVSDRIERYEKLLGELAERSRALEQANEAAENQRSHLEDRMDYCETLVEYSGEKHSRWEVLHGASVREHDVHNEHQDAMNLRVEQLEKALGNADESKFRKDLEIHSEVHSTLKERVDYLEKLVENFQNDMGPIRTQVPGEQNVAMLDRMGLLEKLLEDCASRQTRWEESQLVERISLDETPALARAHASIQQERLDKLEKLFENSAEMHAKWERTHAVHCEEQACLQECLHKFAEDANEKITRLQKGSVEQDCGRQPSLESYASQFPIENSPDKSAALRDRMNYLEKRFWALRF